MAGTNGSATASGADTLKGWNSNMNTLGRAWMTAQNQYTSRGGAGGPIGPETSTSSLDTPADVTAANTQGGSKALPVVSPQAAATPAATTATTSTPTSTPTGGSAGPGYQYTNDHLDTAAKLETQLQQIMSKPFSFDYKNDPSYLAAVQSSLEGAKKASDNTLQEMSDRGILNSSVTSSQLGQIQQDAQNEPLKLVPQLEQNAYGRYQQNLQNVSSLWNTELTAGQNDRTFTMQQQQQKQDNAFKTADVTGKYLSPEAKALVDQVIKDKQTWGGASKADQAKIAADAVTARAALTAMGYDASTLGANVGMDQSLKNATNFGIQTQTAKQNAIGNSQWTQTFNKQGTQFEESRTDNKTQFDLSRKDSNTHFWASYGLQQSAQKLSQSTVKEAKMMQENTNRVLYQMMLQGVNTPNDAAQWLDANKADIDPTKMDVGALRNSVMSMGAGKTASSPGFDTYVKAVELAQKDPSYINAPDAETAQKIVDDLYAKLSALKNPLPLPAPASLTPKQRAQTVTNHKVQWAMRN